MVYVFLVDSKDLHHHKQQLVLDLSLAAEVNSVIHIMVPSCMILMSVLFCSLFTHGIRGSERSGNLLKVTQLMATEGEIRSMIFHMTKKALKELFASVLFPEPWHLAGIPDMLAQRSVA